MVSGNIVTSTDGIPVLYPGACRAFGVRVVNPQNPKAPSKNLSMAIVYVAPGGILLPHSHENEEIYYIVQGEGEGQFGLGKPVSVRKGMFIHLPPDAEHGLKNTGDEILIALTATSPASQPMEEWKTTED